jgi:hypothetical protein
MANRRMFEREIMELDDFVDMPTSSRLLYVYICLDADDEGFLGSPKKVMRAFGGGDDDIKILIAKGFLIAFESGVVVVTNWNEHNKIRADRIKPTRHQAEKEQLQLIDLQWQKPTVNQMSTNCQEVVAECPPSIGLVLDSVEVSIDIVEKNTVRENEFEAFWSLYDLKKNKIGSKKLFMKLTNSDFEDMRIRVKHYVDNTNVDGSYPSRMHPITYLNNANKLWMDEVKIPTKQTNGKENQLGDYGQW